MKAAKALKEKGETPEELLQSIKDNEAAVAEAQRTVDAWKAIVGEKSRREEAAKAESERIATEKAEAERKAAEERERAEAEEKTRIEAEKKEAERIAAEKAEEEARVEAERKAEEERKTKEEERKERDENGQPFVVSSDGTTTFGEITEDTGLTAAPIKLSEGFQDANTGKGYGLVHIEANHGEQIRQAGFTSVKEFVSFVATHYDPDNIRVGKRRDDGSDTFLIQVTDTHDNTLFIELSKDGSYWNVNSGGIFRKGYSNKKETVAKTEPQQPTNAVSSDSSLSANVKDGITNAEPNGEPTVSLDKGTTLPADQQTSDKENTKKVADSEGENTLKAKIEAASADVNTEPTEAQKKAGNYKKGHVQVGTFDITIEQPEGSIRRGTDADGKQWESKMHNTYGYFRGTEGVDGDHIDVFLSNDIDGWNGRKVFVVDQYNPDGTFDEHKVMLGFNDMDEAKSDYLANYEKGWENGRRITVSTTNLEDFEKWIDSSHRKTKPFSEYSSVNKGSEKAEKKQKKQSVFDKAKEIADNHGNHIVVADVRDVDPKKLVGAVDGGEVQYFHASPVCKNFSKAKREGGEVELDKETALSTAEFIAKTRPKVVTIENVKGYRNSEALKIITDELTRQGYDWDADVYNTADYGGYTKRERLIVRAKRDGKLPPKPEKLPEELRKKGWYSAVEDLIPHLEEKKTGVPQGTDERLKNSGIDYRTIDKPLYVFGRGYANKTVGHAFADELLPTLTTGGGDIIIMPDGRVLKASPRVLARVTGLPDTYKMPETDQLSHTIVGNGIPTQLTEGVIAPLLDNAIPSAERATKRESVFDVADRVSQNLEERTRAMGSRVEKRMADVAQKLEGKELSMEQKAVVDVFSGKSDNQKFSVEREDGKKQTYLLKQGNEEKAGAKHSLYRHYGTNTGVITADDVLKIPQVLERGERIEKAKGGKKMAVYTMDVDGAKFTVYTRIGKDYETIDDFYSNKKGSERYVLRNTDGVNNTPEGAHNPDSEPSAKVEDKSESPKLFGEEIIDDGKKGSEAGSIGKCKFSEKFEELLFGR